MWRLCRRLKKKILVKQDTYGTGWGLNKREKKGERENRTISKPDLKPRPDRPTFMAAQVHRVPTYNQRHGAVIPHRDQEQRAILGVDVFGTVDAEQDPESGNGDAGGDDGKGESVLQAV